MIWLLGALGLIAAVLAWEGLRILRARPPRSVRTQLAGSAPSITDSEIPRVIWTYWSEEPPSDFVARCLANWRRYAPDHELRVLHPATIGQWLGPQADVEWFRTLPPVRQSDWLRLQLLRRHGGIWIDASTILTQDLGWVHGARRSGQTEYVGFYIHGFSRRLEQPIVENWFMAAVPGSAFIADLALEFDRVLAIGDVAYLEGLKAQQRLERVVQGLSPAYQEYMVFHVAASALMDAAPSRYRLHLTRAEDSAFSLQAALGWHLFHLYARLALTPRPSRLPALIKIRGTERRVIETQLARRPALRGSIIADYLGA
jgi:hypothetical protein